ncbi:MAG TPA: amidohydrolase family protein [Thermoanaerobaculia bacterium]|nr:amidohydrolase family protein [Thermoanaerobaculia bacterium]
MRLTRTLLLSLALLEFSTDTLIAETIAITGATVHTMSAQGTLQNATVIISNGRISAVGTAVSIPADARRINATGKVVTPGLFNSLTQLGIVEVSAVPGTSDTSSEIDRITAAFDVADAINPHSSLIAVNRIEGLTRVVVAPNAGKTVIAGQGAVIHLGGPGAYLVRDKVAMFAFLGEKGAELTGGARGAAILRLREALQDATDFAANRRAFESGNRRDYALSRLDLEALIPIVRGERPLVVSVHRASDILASLRLSREFSLRLILAGAGEGWKVAREIAAAKVPVLINPIHNLPESFEILGTTLENAARLHKAGVTIAFMTGDAHNARNIKQSAGSAVAYGLPWNMALAAITSVPARIWGLEDRYGTLEQGKDADVVIWDGDPLEVTTFADAVFIRGVQMSMESRQTRLRDRYKDLATPLPPAYSKQP